MNTYYVDKKFLHDLATPLSVAGSALKLLIKDLDDKVETSAKAKIFDRLERAIHAIEKMEAMHADFKIEVEKRKEG